MSPAIGTVAAPGAGMSAAITTVNAPGATMSAAITGGGRRDER